MSTQTKVINAFVDDFMVESYTVKVITYEFKHNQIVIEYVDGYTEQETIDQFLVDFENYKKNQTGSLSEAAKAMAELRNIFEGKPSSDESKKQIDSDEHLSDNEKNAKIMGSIIASLNKILFDEEDTNKEIRNKIKIFNELLQQANAIENDIQDYFHLYCKDSHILSKSDANLYTFIAKERVLPLVEMPVPTLDPFADGNVYFEVNYIGSTDKFFVNSKLFEESTDLEKTSAYYLLTEDIDFPFYAVSFNNSPRAIERVTL